MAQHTAVGIDIGTYSIKVAVASVSSPGSQPKLLATGQADSKGLHHGYIVNTEEVSRGVKSALAEAAKQCNLPLNKVYVSAGGVSLESVRAGGTIIINRQDPEITAVDVERVLKAAERTLPRTYQTNRKILHTIPISFKLDGQPVLGQPVGMQGNKLEVQALFVTYLEQHLNDLIQAVEAAGVEVIDVVAAPIAASFVSLTKTQKMAGCVLANIGAETVSIIIYENDIPISLEVFPLGATDITNDIALDLKIPLEDAEKLKTGSRRNDVPKRKLDDIVEKRLQDMFTLIDSHLTKLGKNGLLPAGIVISGGGSALAKIDDIAKASLALPSRIVETTPILSGQSRYRDATWSVAYGLCLVGLTDSPEDEEEQRTVFAAFGSGLKKFARFLRRLLP